ncbi:MAG: alpha/beta fold hydrolase [Trueperaceae bacterium]|nr:alpha/beta fold hydrolase [Trueperaceae bacterium]
MIRAQHRAHGLALIDHEFHVPLDYQMPEKGKINVFAREVFDVTKDPEALPFLVFLQGGPGSEAPRPDGKSGWLGQALEHYRVLLLDQRGTGLSSPITFQTLAGLNPQEQADYLAQFRADNIVRDAECIREELIGKDTWSLLGQSFGGFCSLSYLSLAPEGLREVFITGGLAAIFHTADELYAATYPIVAEKNRLFFERYPEAQDWARKIADLLLAEAFYLPNGQRFTVEQFQQLGMALGSSTGFEHLYYALERALIRVNGKETLSHTFLHDCFTELGYNRNPLFAILHEAIYCQGSASNWAAERQKAQFPEFIYAKGNDFLFTGEMIYPWMFEQYEALKPLRDAAQLLAEKTDWPPLYKPSGLKENKVPVAAAVYFNDMYVPREYSLETARAIPNTRVWVTSEYEHNGLRADGAHILTKLIQLLNE